MLITLLTLLISTASAQTDIDVNQLSQRFVSTVVEAKTDEQFLAVPQVQDCVKSNAISEADFKLEADVAKKTIRDKQNAASDCVRKAMSGVSDAEIEKMASSLKLRDYGLVRGQGSKAVVDYFSNRLQKALYGPNGKPINLRDQKLIDQSVFFDIYESQIGKNILLEISNYCNSRLISDSDRKTNFTNIAQIVATAPNGSKDRADIEQAIQNQLITLKFKDTTPATLEISNKDDPEAIYKDFVNEVADFSGDAGNSQTRMEKIFSNCTRAIPVMCKIYENCNCYYKKQKDPNETCVTDLDDGKYNLRCEIDTATQEPKMGQHSCHVVARLRGMRANLEATNRAQESLRTNYTGGEAIGINHAGGNYDPSTAADGQTIDDITSLASHEVDDIEKLQGNSQLPDECVTAPESDACKNFIYDDQEGTKFANTAANYTAVTMIETKKLEGIKNDKSKLEEYLVSKGYLDLVAKLKNGDSVKVAEEARQRFEAQREATFAEMSAAFERKQVVGDASQRQQKVADIKKDLEDKSSSFKQLMLFNNVVSSFLNVEKKVGDKYVKAGTNVKSLERESDSNASINPLMGAGGSSQLGAGEAPLVDQSFIDSLLGQLDETVE
jgi:hypothetical protein